MMKKLCAVVFILLFTLTGCGIGVDIVEYGNEGKKWIIVMRLLRQIKKKK